MVEVILKKSTVKGKKYDAIFPDKKVSFGSAPYEDYTVHKDDKRRESYIKRARCHTIVDRYREASNVGTVSTVGKEEHTRSN